MTTKNQEHTEENWDRSKTLLDLRQFEAAVYPTEPQPSQCSSGVTLVSIDVEYDSRLNDISQVGIATLVSTALSNPSINRESSKSPITSRLFLLKRRYLPQNQRTRQYLYEVAEPITGVNLSDFLTAIFVPMGNSRVLLVGHSIMHDILVTKRYCGLDLKALPCIRAIFDTSYIPSVVFDLERRQVSLKKSCQLVGIVPRQLHNAGNDACYTLKVLLLLFRFYKQREVSGNPGLAEDLQFCWETRLEYLKRLGEHNITVTRPPKRIRDPEHQRHTRLHIDDDEVLGLVALGVLNDT